MNSRHFVCGFAALFIFLLPASGWAKASDVNVSGYVKYLSSASDVPVVADGRLYDQLLHARIDTTWYPSDALRGEMDIRLRAFYGDSVEKIPQFSDLIKTDHAFWNLDATLWDETRSVGYGEIDRLWLGYTHGNLEATLGRQRVAWGTALVWNVIDLYNPKSVLDFDYEEKPGVDAVRVQYYTGAVSRLELVAQPERTLKKSTVAGIFGTNALEYDFFLLAGVRQNRWTLGGAWAGSVLEGGFRGEVLVSQAPDSRFDRTEAVPAELGNLIFTSGSPVVSVVLSGDYTFSNTLYLLFECLYNSAGKTRNAGPFWDEALAAGMLSPARWSIYQEIAGDITPLTRASLFGIFNPSDHSSVIVPMLTHSLATDLDLLLIGQFAKGNPYSEYGDYGKSVTLRLKYSF